MCSQSNDSTTLHVEQCQNKQVEAKLLADVGPRGVEEVQIFCNFHAITALERAPKELVPSQLCVRGARMVRVLLAGNVCELACL